LPKSNQLLPDIVHLTRPKKFVHDFSEFIVVTDKQTEAKTYKLVGGGRQNVKWMNAYQVHSWLLVMIGWCGRLHKLTTDAAAAAAAAFSRGQRCVSRRRRHLIWWAASEPAAVHWLRCGGAFCCCQL